MTPEVPLSRTDTAEVSLARMTSPLGRIELTADGTRLLSVRIGYADQLPLDAFGERPSPLLDAAVHQLTEYFAGTRISFDLPLFLDGGTEFQRRVWAALRAIPFGSVTSYGAIAQAVGQPGAGRSVGGAIAANPLPLLVGCHRVLSASGEITGYSQGAGVVTKAWLLTHESIPFLVAPPRKESNKVEAVLDLVGTTPALRGPNHTNLMAGYT